MSDQPQIDAEMPDANPISPATATGVGSSLTPSYSLQQTPTSGPASSPPTATAVDAPPPPPELKITANRFLTFPKPFELTTVNGKAILVGPNGAGKTNVLRVLRLCLDALHNKGSYSLTDVLENASATVELSSLPPETSKILSSLVCLSIWCETTQTLTQDEAALTEAAMFIDKATEELSVSGFLIQVKPDKMTRWMICSFSLMCNMLGKPLKMDFGSSGRNNEVRFRLGAENATSRALWAGLIHQGMPSPGQQHQGVDVRHALRLLTTYSTALSALNNVTDWDKINSQCPWEVFMEVVRVYIPTLFACYPADELGLVTKNTELPNMVSPSRVESALAKIGANTMDGSSRNLWNDTITKLWKSLMDDKELFAAYDDKVKDYRLQIEAPKFGLPKYAFAEASSGEQNVLTVLALLFGMPDVLVVALDEPLSNLYRPLQKEAEWLLNKSNKCVLMTTHATGMLGPRTLSSVFHLSFPGSGQRPVPAEEARVQIERLYPLKSSDNHRENQSHKQVLDPTMRELFFVNGAILVEGPNDERFLAALEEAQIQLQGGLKTETKTPLSHWTVRHRDGKNDIRHAATLLTVLGIPFLVIMDDDGDGFAGKLASRINAIQGANTAHWWGYFQFPGELEDAIVGDHPDTTAEYLKRAPFDKLHEQWVSAHRDGSAGDFPQQLAGSGVYKHGVDVGKKLRELEKVLSRADCPLAHTSTQPQLASLEALIKGAAWTVPKSGLHGLWSEVSFGDLVEDGKALLGNTDESNPRLSYSPDMRRLVTILQAELSGLKQLPKGTDLNDPNN